MIEKAQHFTFRYGALIVIFVVIMFFSITNPYFLLMII